jgi:two-component sensor histidine kinase
VTVPAAYAVSVGLILTELITNANKYAYDGAPGPLQIGLTGTESTATLVVADRGKGRTSSKRGFGSRMVEALTKQLNAEMSSEDNGPGLKVTLRIPLSPS